MQEDNLAPHGGRELSMILNGEKPLAYLERVEGKEFMYDLVIDIWFENIFEVAFIEPDGIAFTLPKNKDLLEDYKKLLSGETVVENNHEYQRLMGRLFGYSEEDIEAFIKQEIKCDCINCKGVSKQDD